MKFTAHEEELIIAALSNMQESDEENGHTELAQQTRNLIDRFIEETKFQQSGILRVKANVK